MIKMRLERNFRNVLNAALGDYLRRDGTLPMTGNLDLDGNSLILDADGDSYIDTSVDDNMQYHVGTAVYQMTGSYFGVQNRAVLVNRNASASNPGVCPEQSDDGTGTGWAGNGMPTMTSSQVEAQRWIVKVDTDSDLNDILLTGVSGFHGIALVTSLTDNVSAIYHIDNVTITGVISANALFSNTPGNAGTYNFYYNVDQFKLENKVGNDKSVQVIFWVVPT